MKITGGILKGRNIISSDDLSIRPTSSKAREGIFNVLYSLSFEIRDKKILELFAGSGLISFESISRGASFSTMVDASSHSLSIISKNINSLGLKDKVELVQDDAVRYVNTKDLTSYDIVFFDPPYDFNFREQIITSLSNRVLDRTLIIMECGGHIDFSLPDNLKVLKEKKWGRNIVYFVSKK
jgi:16S rRNA (guanine966-N2)-methyltransferase